MNKNYQLLIKNIQDGTNDFNCKINEYFIKLIDGVKTDTLPNYLVLNIEKMNLYETLCNYYNIYENEENKNKRIKEIINNPLVEIKTIEEQSLTFSFNNLSIITKQLYGNIKGVKKTDYLNNYYEDNIYIPKLIELSKKLNFKNKICIGYSKKYNDDVKKIQAWIEFSDTFNHEWVIDFVNNILINKQGYYELNNIEVINTISNEQIKKEKEMYSFIIEYLNLSDIEYLLFNNELVKEIKERLRN